MEQEHSYDIEYIFGKQRDKEKDKTLYQVKWDGFSRADATSEPLENFMNETVRCVTRFERCLNYQQYHELVKRSGTNGIRIHILGQYQQTFVPEKILIKPNRDKSIPVKVQAPTTVTPAPIPKPVKNQLPQESPSSSVTRQSDIKFEDDTSRKTGSNFGKFGAKQVVPKREEDDHVKPKFNDRDVLPKVYQEHIRPPSAREREQNYANSGRYALLNTKPSDAVNHVPLNKERPKIKTERDYLNEIIRAQQAKENSQNPHIQNGFMPKMADQIKMNDGESMIGGNVKFNNDEITVPQRVVYPLPQFKKISQQSTFCDDLQVPQLADNIFVLEKKGERFLKLAQQHMPKVSINKIISHALAQLGTDKTVRLVFQVVLDNQNIVFTTVEYLQDHMTHQLIDYVIENAIFH